MPRRFRAGLALKINLIVVLVVLVSGIVLGVFMASEQEKALETGLRRRIGILGEHLAQDIGRAAARNDAGSVDRLLRDATIDNEVAYVMTKSIGGEVLAARWVGRGRGDVAEFDFPIRAPAADPGKPGELFGGVAPAPPGEAIGRLAIGVDMSAQKASLARLLRRTALAVSLAVAATALLGFLVVRGLLRRSVTPILDVIRTRSSGDLVRRVGPVPNDEIGEIGRAFDAMTDRLSTILVTKQELESTVLRRTNDISEREERIRLLLNSTAEAIYGIDADGICTFCNPSCVRLLGFASAEAIVGKNVHDLVHSRKPDGERRHADECGIMGVLRERKGYHSRSEVFMKADGTALPIECWSYPIVRGDEFLGAVVTFLDITERIELERQLLQSQKLEGIGVLAGGVAHDFNNLLTPILGYTEMAMEKLEAGHPARADLEAVHESAERAADVARQILAFSRKQVLEMKVLDLNRTIASATKMLRRLIGEDIEIRLDLAAGLPRVKADPTQVQQVLVNMAVNARDAMADGGTLTIRTEPADVDGPRVGGRRELPPGRYVVLSLTDTGTGMDEETCRRVFEPFFTTKGAGRGTGLGLSTVHGIVKQHGGDVTVYSEPGVGTTFRIYLPVSREAPAVEIPLSRPLESGSGTILLVEDDPTVRELGRAILTDHGYAVTCAADGFEAIEAAYARPFDLLISDVVMPGMNGRELARRVAAVHPSIRVLLVSGYPAGAAVLQGIVEEENPFLQKPFTVSSLLEKVREVLDGAAPGRGSA